LVKSLKGSWPFWLHHKIDPPPKDIVVNTILFLQLFSYSQKWRCSTQKFSQIWLLQAKNENKNKNMEKILQ
jgi:hypothetical protein